MHDTMVTKARKAMRRAATKAKGSPGLVFRSADFIAPYQAVLQYECSAQDLSLAVLAAKAQVGYDTASRHVHGEIREPRMSTCLRLLEAIGYHLFARS